jgi:hypothetical protein
MMLKEKEIRVLVASEEDFSNVEIKPSGEYLNQNVDNYNFLIHREIKESERKSYKENEMFLYEDKLYLFIANAPTEEKAELAIQSYWKAIKQLNELPN